MAANGSVIKRGKVYYFRFRKIDGKYTQRALKDGAGNRVTVKAEAERLAAVMQRELQQLETLNSKAEYLARVAEVKKIIRQETLKNTDIWQAYLNNPNRPESGPCMLSPLPRSLPCICRKQTDNDGLRRSIYDRIVEYRNLFPYL